MHARSRVIDREAERQLVRALRGRGGKLTVADAQALSGLPGPRVEQALSTMLSTYRSHLAATATGALLYAFDPALTRRDAVPLRDRLERALELGWRGFVVALKVAIITVLAVYFVVFVALLIGLVVARLASQRDDSDHHGDGIVPLWLLWWFLPWDFGVAHADRGPYPQGLRRLRKKLHQQVFDFVFGPARGRGGPDGFDREMLAYLRAHQGRLTAAELVALRGLDLRRAEQEATRLMCEHGGEPEVTDDGVVIYVFRDLRKTAGEVDVGRWTYAWERLEKRPVLTGNTTTANVIIGAVNGFNLLAPLWLVPAALAAFGWSGSTAATWLQVVPLVFSVTLFVVLAGRAGKRALDEEGRRRRNRQRLILRELFGGSNPSRRLPTDGLAQPLAPAVLLHAAGRGDAREAAAARRELDALLVPLGGDVVLDGDPEHLGRLAFPRLDAELRAVQGERERAPASESEIGPVVFDSAAELEPGSQSRLEDRSAAPSPWRLTPGMALVPPAGGKHGGR